MYGFLKKKSVTSEILPKVRGKYLYNVSMKKYTSFGVGGNAEVMFFPEDADDLIDFFRQKPHNLPTFILGSGSNLLVRDGGIVGVVIKLSTPFFKKYERKDDKLICYAGMQNASLLKIMCDEQLSGLEFLCTIPGTIGGAVRTNAGCFGCMISDLLDSALVVDAYGEKKIVSADDLSLGYRSSMFPDDWIIISLCFNMKKATKDDIKNKVLEYNTYRKEHQPLNTRNAGSFFKNPNGLKAWELIKNCGCDKLKVGGAQVSEVHNNFLINNGTATAEDIESLADEIIERVKKQAFVTLEYEVKRVGIKK